MAGAGSEGSVGGVASRAGAMGSMCRQRALRASRGQMGWNHWAFGSIRHSYREGMGWPGCRSHGPSWALAGVLAVRPNLGWAEDWGQEGQGREVAGLHLYGRQEGCCCGLSCCRHLIFYLQLLASLLVFLMRQLSFFSF